MLNRICRLSTALVMALTVSPHASGQVELATLVADDPGNGDQLGGAVAISGDIAIAGARYDDQRAGDAGAAYIFARNQGGADNWGQVAKLTASDAGLNHHFGNAVAINGELAIVGAIYNNTGAAYVFARNQGGPDNWGQVAKLLSDDGVSGDYFGCAVAIDADTVVVGARNKSDVALYSGAAYIFHQNEGGPDQWGQVRKLSAVEVTIYHYYGYAVAISGNVAVVGSMQINDAFVFMRDLGGTDNWGQAARLLADDRAVGDYFGRAVAAANNGMALVGATHDDHAGGTNVGSAYLFAQDWGGPDNWGQVAKLTGSDGAENDYFGCSVGLSGDRAVVGAYYDDDQGHASGSTYVFVRDQGEADQWGQVAKLLADAGGSTDLFGCSVGLSGDLAVIGARQDDHAANDCGSARVFDIPGCAGDLSANEVVNVTDLLTLLAAWGGIEGDITGDGVTNVTDLLALLAAWGACP